MSMNEKGKSVICGTCPLCRRYAECGDRLESAVEVGSGSKSPAGGNVGLMCEKAKVCKCGSGYCKILTSKKEQSKGWRFYCCPESTGPKNHGCGMFEWVPVPEGATSSNIGSSTSLIEAVHPSSEKLGSTSLYARGYLDAAIRASEQHTYALKNILEALTKLEVKEK